MPATNKRRRGQATVPEINILLEKILQGDKLKKC